MNEESLWRKKKNLLATPRPESFINLSLFIRDGSPPGMWTIWHLWGPVPRDQATGLMLPSYHYVHSSPLSTLHKSALACRQQPSQHSLKGKPHGLPPSNPLAGWTRSRHLTRKESICGLGWANWTLNWELRAEPAVGCYKEDRSEDYHLINVFKSIRP